MIHINIDDKELSEDWLCKAESVTEQLKSLDSSEERKKLIEKRSKLWGELKDWLLELSHGKCWYSEAREIFSFYEVDHFRPKNRAKQLDGTEREGYWWLAFDWRNYRISGSVGNNRKGDYFPLAKGSPVATGPECDLQDEIIYLLDPTDPDDPFLLTFDESGYPKPAVTEEEDKWAYERVIQTINLLHLDFGPLVNGRQKIWSNCTRLINQAQKLMKEQSENPSVTKKAKLRDKFRELREIISVETELSSTARACLSSSGITWAKSFVSRA